MNLNDDKPIIYLTVSDIYNINDAVTEGHTFVRDVASLSYAVQRPKLTLFGEAQFPTLIDKAASLLHSLAYHHLFADGNKRTAVYALVLFLEKNGWQIDWNRAEARRFILEIAQGKHDVPAIAAWLTPQIVPLDAPAQPPM
jgi:death-on-curing protein